MRKIRLPIALFAAALLLTLAATACGGDGGDQAALDEEAVQTAVATAGAAQFSAAGIEVEGGLDCAATATPAGDSDTTDASGFTVECTGTTADGQGLTLNGEGTQDGDTERGTFVGKSGDKQVFETKCLGTNC
jgi:hypothetical protein